MFKTVVLGIQYGLGAASLAIRTGISVYEAAEILARLRARFRAFEEFARRAVDHAGLLLEVDTPFAWTMQCPPEINPRTVRNFPIQSTAAEILHVACVLAERRGICVVAPVHDAIVAEMPAAQIEDVSAALDRVMPPPWCCAYTSFQPTSSKFFLASAFMTSAVRQCGTPSPSWWPSGRRRARE